MAAEPDFYIEAKSGKEPKAKNLWTKRGNLLIPADISLDTCKIVAAFSDLPLVGSKWVPVKPRQNVPKYALEKALCVWLNSTPGVLAQIIRSTPNALRRVNMSIEGQRNIPVPDFTPGQIDHLAQVYEDEKGRNQQRLSDPAAPGRVVLDDAVAEALGIAKSLMKQVRKELSKEPAITNEQYAP